MAGIEKVCRPTVVMEENTKNEKQVSTGTESSSFKSPRSPAGFPRTAMLFRYRRIGVLRNIGANPSSNALQYRAPRGDQGPAPAEGGPDRH